MKIAIPADNSDMNATVCQSFGRTPYFLIYDTDTDEAEFMSNAAASSSGGAGVKAAQAVVDAKVESILTPRCGQNAADILISAGISIYKTEGESLKENIEAFKKGALAPLNEIHAGFHNH